MSIAQYNHTVKTVDETDPIIAVHYRGYDGIRACKSPTTGYKSSQHYCMVTCVFCRETEQYKNDLKKDAEFFRW